MLGDILHFAATILVDDGRLSIWMPTANDAEVKLGIPQHQALELVSSCIQVFNKCSKPVSILFTRQLTDHRVQKAPHISEAPKY